MGDTWDGNAGETYESDEDFIRSVDLVESQHINFESLFKTENLEAVADKILESALGETDFMKKDVVDRFLDFIYFKVQTGSIDIPHMAYPTKRMIDRELEQRVITLLNEHLYPEIVLRLMKLFSRNIHNPDTNLYIANLITSEDIIRSIYETFKLFKKDIFISNPVKRSLNVKRIQQFAARSENKLSSPLDQAAIYKYILEFLAIKFNVSHIYTEDDLLLSAPVD